MRIYFACEIGLKNLTLKSYPVGQINFIKTSGPPRRARALFVFSCLLSSVFLGSFFPFFLYFFPFFWSNYKGMVMVFTMSVINYSPELFSHFPLAILHFHIFPLALLHFHIFRAALLHFLIFLKFFSYAFSKIVIRRSSSF